MATTWQSPGPASVPQTPSYSCSATPRSPPAARWRTPRPINIGNYAWQPRGPILETRRPPVWCPHPNALSCRDEVRHDLGKEELHLRWDRPTRVRLPDQVQALVDRGEPELPVEQHDVV